MKKRIWCIINKQNYWNCFKKGLIEIKNKIIVDSTHTNSMFHHVSAREELIRQAKELRKSVYKIDESIKINCLKKRIIRFIRRTNWIHKRITKSC